MESDREEPEGSPNCQYVQVDDRQGFQHPSPRNVPLAYTPAVVSSRSTFSSTHTSVPPGAELTAAYGRTFYFKEGEFERGDRQGMEGTTGKVCVCARAQCEGLGASTGVCARE